MQTGNEKKQYGRTALYGNKQKSKGGFAESLPVLTLHLYTYNMC